MARYVIIDDASKRAILRDAVPDSWHIALGMGLLDTAPGLGLDIRSMRARWTEPRFLNGKKAYKPAELTGQRVYVLADAGPAGELFAQRVQDSIGTRVRRVVLEGSEDVREAFKRAGTVDSAVAGGEYARHAINLMLAHKVQPVISAALDEDMPLSRPLLAVLSVLLARKEARRAPAPLMHIIRATLADGTEISSVPMVNAVVTRMTAALDKGQYRCRRKRMGAQANVLPELTVTDYFVQMATRDIDPSVAYGALLQLHANGCINFPGSGDTVLRRIKPWKVRGSGFQYTLFGWLAWRLDNTGAKASETQITRYTWVWKPNERRVILAYDAVEVMTEGWDATEEGVDIEVQAPERGRIVEARYEDHYPRPEQHDIASLIAALADTGVTRTSDLTEGLQQAVDQGLVVRTRENHYLLHQRGEVVVALVNQLFAFATDPDHIAKEERRLRAIEGGRIDARAYLKRLYREVITPLALEERHIDLPTCHHKPMRLHFNSPGALPHLECVTCHSITPLDVVAGRIRPYSSPQVHGCCTSCANTKSLREGIRPTGRYVYCSLCWSDQPE